MSLKDFGEMEMAEGFRNFCTEMQKATPADPAAQEVAQELMRYTAAASEMMKVSRLSQNAYIHPALFQFKLVAANILTESTKQLSIAFIRCMTKIKKEKR